MIQKCQEKHESKNTAWRAKMWMTWANFSGVIEDSDDKEAVAVQSS